MKILYGVQGTGNGHISRARAMAGALARFPSVQVDWLFSGRPRDALFDMDAFGDYLWRPGLTFATRRGAIAYWATARQCQPLRFVRDVLSLQTSSYDLIVTDFEPVTAWAGRLGGRRVVGIGHQYAFRHDIPSSGSDPLGALVMQHFAPAGLAVGLHWHHFGQSILPPIVDLGAAIQPSQGDGSILVYLPFETPGDIMALLARQRAHRFVVYHPNLGDGESDKVSTRRLSALGFKRDLAGCSGVVCSAGFELIAEALTLGKKVLVKPVAGQMEQRANAMALQRLGFVQVMHYLDDDALAAWLATPAAPAPISWPDVAGELAAWIAGGCCEDVATLAARLWLRAADHEPRPGSWPHAAECI